MIARRCIVSGRVQGVFYRKSAQARARALGVRGHARNLPDGRVEVLAIGESGPVATFVEWLWEGSSASRVTAVEVEQVDAVELQRTEGFSTG